LPYGGHKRPPQLKVGILLGRPYLRVCPVLLATNPFTLLRLGDDLGIHRANATEVDTAETS
jgi:hypothetical protein